MLESSLLRGKFDAGLAYGMYLETGTPPQREQWRNAGEKVMLTLEQRSLIGAFTRRINVLVLSGLWCGDCSSQCPMIARIGEANTALIQARFLDRDGHPDFAKRFSIAGGLRVPTVIFMNEDFDFVSLLGDKTLSRLRATAARKLGPSCPLPGAPVAAEETAATLQDWVNEFERVHLLLRLSTKLRARYED
jgi:thiol-disulfide isomerase/thioredoxin